jgi:hypothetical protein
MIRVRMELDSSRGPERDRLLGTAEIENLGTGDQTHGNYHARFYGADGRLWRETELFGWARKRWHPWLLLLFALLKAVGQELRHDVERAWRRSGSEARRKLFGGACSDSPLEMQQHKERRERIEARILRDMEKAEAKQ